MKRRLIIVALSLMPVASSAQSFRVDWWTISPGGGHSRTAAYQVDGTIGQAIVGGSATAFYRVEAGFWVGAGPWFCEYLAGDVNNSGIANGIDVVYAVSYFKGGAPPLVNCARPAGPCPQASPFYAALDVNGSCSTNGIDITFYVSFLKGGPAIICCPSCPPADPGRLSPAAVGSLISLQTKRAE
jgi:hypothetical protein